MKRKRLQPETRKTDILIGAVAVAVDVGFHRLNRPLVANKVGCSVALINNYWSTMCKLRRAVMRYAVHNEILPIIANGIITGDRQVLKTPESLRTRALRSML